MFRTRETQLSYNPYCTREYHWSLTSFGPVWYRGKYISLFPQSQVGGITGVSQVLDLLDIRVIHLWFTLNHTQEDHWFLTSCRPVWNATQFYPRLIKGGSQVSFQFQTCVKPERFNRVCPQILLVVIAGVSQVLDLCDIRKIQLSLIQYCTWKDDRCLSSFRHVEYTWIVAQFPLRLH